MATLTTVKVLINQRGNSNKIWAQVVSLSDAKGRSAVIHGPIKQNGAGLVENVSNANAMDKMRNGYDSLVTFLNVPHGFEKECVAGVAHVMAGGMPLYFTGGSFGRDCAGLFKQDNARFGSDITINLSTLKDGGIPEPEPAPEPKHDLTNLLKSTRPSGFF
ncbi:MAG: hypothetical protein AB1664_20210 [Thermodesulfobacteriota bacterium]